MLLIGGIPVLGTPEGGGGWSTARQTTIDDGRASLGLSLAQPNTTLGNLRLPPSIPRRPTLLARPLAADKMHLGSEAANNSWLGACLYVTWPGFAAGTSLITHVFHCNRARRRLRGGRDRVQ